MLGSRTFDGQSFIFFLRRARASTCICALIHKTLYLHWCGCIHTWTILISWRFFLRWRNNSPMSDCEVSIIFIPRQAHSTSHTEPYLYLSSPSNFLHAKNAIFATKKNQENAEECLFFNKHIFTNMCFRISFLFSRRIYACIVGLLYRNVFRFIVVPQAALMCVEAM
jgi:hypothetical protein